MGTVPRRLRLHITTLRMRLLLLVVSFLVGTYVLGPLFLWTYNVEHASRLISAGLISPSPHAIDSLPVLKDDVLLEEALGYLSASKRWRPLNERAYRLAGKIYVARGDLIKAAEALETARAYNPRNPLLAWDVSLVYERMWQTSQVAPQDAKTVQYSAIEPDIRMREAWRKAGMSWQEFVKQAQASINSKSIDNARTWVDRARMVDIQSGVAWRTLGQVYIQLADMSEARLAYEEASRLSPESVDTWYELGGLYLQGREATQALQAYSRALEASSGTVGRSVIYYQIGIVRQSYLVPPDPAGAWEAFEHALVIDDFATWPIARAETHVQLGRLRVAEHRWNEGLAEYAQALVLEPDLISAHYYRAVTLWRMNNHAEARASLEKIIQLKPDYKETYRLLGNFAQEQDNLDEARQMYLRVLELDPQDEPARTALEALK